MASPSGSRVFTLFVSQLLGKPRPTAAKSAVYECGVPAIGNARERFPIKFYLVCMIFILLDVDAAFLYPWALIFRQLGRSSGSSRWSSSSSSWAAGSSTPGRSGALDWYTWNSPREQGELRPHPGALSR